MSDHTRRRLGSQISLVDSPRIASITWMRSAASAFGLSRMGLSESRKKAGRSGAGGLRSGIARNFLVVAEVDLALVLLVGAGLLVRTLHPLKGFRLFAQVRKISEGE